MKLPRWYVSSPHKVGAFGLERPYGVRHAREPGAAFTECGEWALNWTLFWDLPFDANQELICQSCQSLVIHQEFGVLSPDHAVGEVTSVRPGVACEPTERR